ncbi:hypothetical protein HPB50_013574 [Hyalomma asiaticum]|uniref:Uncharacterized protein n=1 Tax=Hyalomma asiaticum TaxID=266040 RepID=A0ACB7RTM5_HYAAI|nr:hypothetical protein HPB50_013574 [Hyalomma asiaticum]
MEADAEDHSYRHRSNSGADAGCGLSVSERSSGCDIFQITGNGTTLPSTNGKRQLHDHRPHLHYHQQQPQLHHNHHHHHHHQSHHRQTCGRHSIDGACRNNNIVITPTDYFQLEQADEKSRRGLSLGNLLSTGNHHAYTALTRALDSGSSLKSPLDSCGESCILDTSGSTTALLETVEKSSRSGGRAEKRSLGDEADECCDSAFPAGWNWPAIRIGCLLLCVSCLVAVLCVVVGVLLLRPSSCDPPKQWWQGAVMYEVFVASFVDSDGMASATSSHVLEQYSASSWLCHSKDGNPSSQGLSSRLDYIRHRIGASALRLTSVFSALDYPLEYEHIIDFDNVDPHLGHMEDFSAFVERAHELGLRVVLDINPTVTSDQHSWAAHWLLDPYGDYANYYVPVNESAIMNNGYDEWEDADDDDRRDPQRPFGNQLYLNWSHPEVRQQVMRSLSVWLEKGVDGFYLKHLDRLQVSDDRELYEVLLSWRRLLDEQDYADERGRILMTSVNLAQELADRDSLFTKPILALFDLLDVHVPLEGGPGQRHADHGVAVRAGHAADETRCPSHSRWNVGDSESPRLASRLVDVDPLAALFTLWGMPGTVSLFYGDEIGMKDSLDQSTGRPFRTGQLGPMQWSDAAHANFSSPASRPWMPAHPDHVVRNVDNASEVIDTLARAAELRSSVVTLYMAGVPSLRHRRCNTKVVRDCGDIFAMERFYPHRARYAVVANFAPRGVTSDLSDLAFEGNVVAGTCSSLPTRVNFRELYLEPGEALYVEITS